VPGVKSSKLYYFAISLTGPLLICTAESPVLYAMSNGSITPRMHLVMMINRTTVWAYSRPIGRLLSLLSFAGW